MAHDPVRLRTRDIETADIDEAARLMKKHLERINARLGEFGFEGQVDIPTRQARKGWISNVQAVVSNESRRAKESILDLSGQASPKAEVFRWIQRFSINPNLVELSTTTHPRALYRAAMWNLIQSAPGITHVVPIIARADEKHVTPTGSLSRILGRVLTLREYLAAVETLGKGRKSLSLAMSLGLHHGDRSQLMPLTAEMVASAAAFFRTWRQDFLGRLGP